MLYLTTRDPKKWFDFSLQHKVWNRQKSNWKHKPQLIKTPGRVSTTFKFDDQEVYISYGVTFQNNYFWRTNFQINDCGLFNIGPTPFNHYIGACGSTNEAVIRCFSYSDAITCQQASSPTEPWTQMTLSTYGHKQTSIARTWTCDQPSTQMTSDVAETNRLD